MDDGRKIDVPDTIIPLILEYNFRPGAERWFCKVELLDADDYTGYDTDYLSFGDMKFYIDDRYRYINDGKVCDHVILSKEKMLSGIKKYFL